MPHGKEIVGSTHANDAFSIKHEMEQRHTFHPSILFPIKHCVPTKSNRTKSETLNTKQES